MAAPKQKKVNLLAQEGFEHTSIGKALNWLLGAGRIIVILTELIVIIAFLSRFWLDRQLTDLIEENKAKKSQVQASSKFETDYKNLQSRLAAIQALEQQKISPSTYIKESAKLLPAGVILSSTILDKNKMSFDGLSLNEAGLSGFMRLLEESDKFANVNLSGISLDKSTIGAIKFTLSAEIESNQNKKTN